MSQGLLLCGWEGLSGAALLPEATAVGERGETGGTTFDQVSWGPYGWGAGRDSILGA